jgi:predicted short-subunit dehydrogenase-like oxidoreductase (DUF2520 family)
LLVEGSNPEVTVILLELADRISDRVEEIDEEKRFALHLSAVFANNFVNHLYTLAADLLESYGLSFSLLEPLIEETTRKARTKDPADAQTGPAIRNDTNIIKKHLDLLNFSPELKELYSSLSSGIQERHKSG